MFQNPALRIAKPLATSKEKSLKYENTRTCNWKQ